MSQRNERHTIRPRYLVARRPSRIACQPIDDAAPIEPLRHDANHVPVEDQPEDLFDAAVDAAPRAASDFVIMLADVSL